MAAINGVMIGIITDAMDPMGRGRVRLRIPAMPGADSAWALTCVPFGGPAAAKPKVSDQVVIAFENGDSSRLVVLGKLAG